MRETVELCHFNSTRAFSFHSILLIAAIRTEERPLPGFGAGGEDSTSMNRDALTRSKVNLTYSTCEKTRCWVHIGIIIPQSTRQKKNNKLRCSHKYRRRNFQQIMTYGATFKAIRIDLTVEIEHYATLRVSTYAYGARYFGRQSKTHVWIYTFMSTARTDETPNAENNQYSKTWK